MSSPDPVDAELVALVEAAWAQLARLRAALDEAVALITPDDRDSA